MATRQEIAAVYAAAVIQGVVLVTFPAVSAIFTSKAHYGLSTTEYGGMFAPQAVTAIVASLLGAGLTHRIGGKRVFQIGLAADLLSMGLLFTSQFATGTHPLAYGLLLAATACLGVGFGFTVPALNTFTAAFFPNKVDQSILTLNALLGTGTALAPIFATIFVGLHFWWGLPLLMSGLTLALIVFSLRLPLHDGKSEPAAVALAKPSSPPKATFETMADPLPVNRIVGTGDVLPESFEKPKGPGPASASPASAPQFQSVNRLKNPEVTFQPAPNPTAQPKGIPARFWLYAAFALLYGIGETMSGNWGNVYMSTELGASVTLASMALTTFWVTVTAGRILFAVIGKWCPPRWVYRALPVVMAMAFIATAAVPKEYPVVAILCFGLAGLGCSALLPLVISFAQEELTTMTAAVAGGMIGFYQMGYGIAAFGVGPLQSMAGLSLAGIYRGSAGVALALAVIAFLIVGHKRIGLTRPNGG
jgi:MFS family permease